MPAGESSGSQHRPRGSQSAAYSGPKYSLSESHPIHLEWDLARWIDNYERHYLNTRMGCSTEPLSGGDEATRDWRRKALQPLRDLARSTKGLPFEAFGQSQQQEVHPATTQPETSLYQEKLAETLETVWADWKFWKRVREDPDQVGLLPAQVHHLQETYSLNLQLGNPVWKAMVHEPALRNYLFVLQLGCARSLFRVEFPSAVKDPLLEALPDMVDMGDLLHSYMIRPLADWRQSLVAHDYSKDQLQLLRKAVNRMSEDLSWCLHHPGQLPPDRPPSLPHRTPGLDRARQLEDMVDYLRAKPEASDYELGKCVLGKFVEGGCREARDARQLASLRDQLPVVFHQPRGARKAG